MSKFLFGLFFFIAIAFFSFWFGEQVAIRESLDPIYVVLGIGAMMASFFRPTFGLGLMIFSTLLLPGISAGTVQGQSDYAGGRGITLRAEDFIIIAVTFGWLAQAAVRKVIGTRDERSSITFIHWIYLFIVVMIISTAVGNVLQTTTWSRSFFFFAKRIEYFMIFFMTRNIVRNASQAVRYFKVFLLVSSIVTAVGVYEIFVMRTTISTGTFGSSGANVLGAFLLLLLPVLLHLQSRVQGVTRFRITLFLAAAALTFLYARSRGAYLAIPLVFSIYVFLTRRYQLIIPFFVILGVGSLMLPKDIRTDFSSLEGVIAKKTRTSEAFVRKRISSMSPREMGAMIQHMNMESSWRQRLVGAAVVMELIQKNPVLGGGLGSIDLAYTDNQYAMDFGSLGILGSAVFLILIFQIGLFLRKLWDMVKDGDPWISSLTIGFLCGLCGMMIHGMTITNFYTIRTMVPFWFLLGLLAVVHRELPYLSGNRSPYTRTVR